MIRHTVVFRLKHPPGSASERAFLSASLELGSIPGVQKLELLRQVSSKNGFHFGLSMEFSDPAAYAAYNEHPVHTRFVEDRWRAEVEDFLEIDYTPLFPGGSPGNSSEMPLGELPSS